MVRAEILQGLRAGGPLVLCPGREGPPLGTWRVSRWTGRQGQEGRTATGGWWGHGCRGVGLAAGRGARLPAGTEGTVPLLVASPSWQESDFVHGCSPAPTCLSQEKNWVEEIRSHRKFVSAWFRGHRLRMAKFLGSSPGTGRLTWGSESPGWCGQGAQGPGCGWVRLVMGKAVLAGGRFGIRGGLCVRRPSPQGVPMGLGGRQVAVASRVPWVG